MDDKITEITIRFTKATEAYRVAVENATRSITELSKTIGFMAKKQRHRQKYERMTARRRK